MMAAIQILSLSSRINTTFMQYAISSKLKGSVQSCTVCCHCCSRFLNIRNVSKMLICLIIDVFVYTAEQSQG